MTEYDIDAISYALFGDEYNTTYDVNGNRIPNLFDLLFESWNKGNNGEDWGSDTRPHMQKKLKDFKDKFEIYLR